MLAAGVLADATDPWIRWDWVFRHIPVIGGALVQHVQLTAIAVGIGLLISLPLGFWAWRIPLARGPILSLTGILYTIPSLALFAILVPFTGLSTLTAEIGLVSYTLLILIRNVVVGLDGVPAEVREAATGMGYRPLARLIRIDFPLAVPAIIAGIRIATVTTIGLVTVTALIGLGGLGELILQGLINDFKSPLLVGAVLSVALAVVADLSLSGLQRLATPWSRGEGRA
ncbi:MAG TPA: ABC transporter permease [Candidatus Limnocylindrales bacterium]|nr:ABC transporter permease [Candidatus Limnocylindrales bacterium]